MYSLCHCFSDIQAVLLYMECEGGSSYYILCVIVSLIYRLFFFTWSVKEVRHNVFFVSLFL